MKITLAASIFLLFFTLAPAVALAADGCSSAGSGCTVNGNAGVCAQNPDDGSFYCRPSALDQPTRQTSGNSSFVPLAGIPGLTEGATADSAGLANFFNNLYKYLIGISAALAIIMIIWGGLEISTQDSISKQGAGKEKIKQAFFGLLLVLSPVLVFSIINPSILNLSLNLPALDTKFNAPERIQATTPYTLSETEKQLRESSGGTTVSSFTIDQNASGRSRIQILDTKQTECTAATNGLGVVLPGTETGGGVLHYVCQTCPPNTTVTLVAKGTGIGGSGARGSCQVN